MKSSHTDRMICEVSKKGVDWYMMSFGGIELCAWFYVFDDIIQVEQW